MLVVYADEHQWRTLENGHAADMLHHETVEKPCTVVWLPERSLTGVAAFEGDPRHAGVLIQRRLRAEGVIDLESKVFIHHIERVGKTYQALYSCASLAEWQRMQAWVGAQLQHCAWLSTVSLAWSVVTPTTGVVLHAGNTLQFFGCIKGKIAFANTLAIDDGIDSLRYAADSLGARAKAECETAGVAPLEVHWISAFQTLGDTGAQQLVDAFRASSGLVVSMLDEVLLLEGEPKVRSALPSLTKKPPLKLLLNAPRDQVFLAADRYRSAAVVAAVLVAVAGIVGGAHGLGQRAELRRAAATMRAEAASIGNVPVVEPSSEELRAQEVQLAFVDTLVKIQSGFDVEHVLQALKRAAGKDIRLLSVRSEESKAKSDQEAEQRAVVVDGVVQEGSKTPDSVALSAFVRSLADSGYTATPTESRASAVASSVSSRLFSYRLKTRAEPSTRRETKP